MNGLQNKYNVIITGAGVSGCMAAIAAAREGASVLLLEQYGFSGGALTNAGVGPMMTFHAGTKQVVGGLAQELVDRLVEAGGSTGHIEDSTGYVSTVTPFAPETLKRYWMRCFWKQVWRFCTIHSSVLQRPKAENLYL